MVSSCHLKSVGEAVGRLIVLGVSNCLGGEKGAGSLIHRLTKINFIWINT